MPFNCPNINLMREMVTEGTGLQWDTYGGLKKGDNNDEIIQNLHIPTKHL
jgi:hypothetical protein